MQPPLTTRLAGAWCLLVVRRLRRRAHSPKRDHDGHAQGISVTLIARRPLGFQGTRGGLGAGPGWAAGAEAVGHAAALELPRAGQRELGPQDTWRPRGCPGPGSGSWVRRTRGGPGAAPGRAMGAGSAGHVAVPELAFCLDLELVRGGTRSSGYRHLPLSNRVVAASSLCRRGGEGEDV
jgi:hypothetical protein